MSGGTVFIGLAGPAGAGKSTLAAALVNALKCAGQHALVDNFAKALKMLVCSLYGAGEKNQDLSREWRSFEEHKEWRRMIVDMIARAASGNNSPVEDLEIRVRDAMNALKPYYILREDKPDDGSVMYATFDLTRGRLLQLLGTEVMRAVYDDVFVGLALNSYDADDGSTTVVLDDVRFANEVAAIHQRGGKVFRVSRGAAPPADGRDAAHPSEAYMSLAVDGEIDNSGDLPTALKTLLDALN